MMPAAGPLIRLVRLPSVVTVPGDVLTGAAWGQDPKAAGTTARVASSALAYLGGMALNDWADREEDARERPGRPIPAGEIGPETALAVAVGLSLAALALAAGGDRDPDRRGPGLTVPLVATVWAYDLYAKHTPTGPWTMALARTLDVLVGAGRPRRGALAPAGLIGAHTLLITIVSRREAHGAGRQLAAGALAGVAVTAGAAFGLVRRQGSTDRRVDRGLQIGAVAIYASIMTRAGIGALRDGDAASAQRFVGAGVFANMPLQAAMLAARGRGAQAAAVLGCWQFGRRLGRKVAVT
jgi:UbiA prenyltransferase family